MIVREHEDDHNAQEVMRKLRQHHLESELTRQELLRLTRKITSLKLDETWKGTTRSFLLHYKEVFRQLDAISPSSERIPESLRISLLSQAVEGVDDFRRVRITDNVFRQKNHITTPLSYQSYFELLKEAAIHLDENNRPNLKSKSRNVYEMYQEEA